MKTVDIFALVQASLTAIDKRLNGSGDVARMRKETSLCFFSEATAKYLAGMGIKPETLAGIFPADGTINPKVPMRFAQFVNALHAAHYPSFDLTTCRALLALRDAGGTLNRDALHYILTGKVSTPDSPNTRGVSLRSLDAIVGRIGHSTVETQLSRSFGAHGFCGTLGMTTTTGRTNFVATLNPDASFSRRFFALIDGATKGQIESIGDK